MILHRLKRVAAWVILASSLGGIYGCAGGAMGTNYLDNGTPVDRNWVVATPPFENLSNNPSAGLIVSQLFQTYIYSRHVFQLLEESELRRKLVENKIDINHLQDTTVAAKVARQLGVNAILVGSVSEFSYQHGLREEPAVGVTARLIHAEDGRVLWAASYSKTGSNWWQRDSIITTAQEVVARMVRGLSSKQRVPASEPLSDHITEASQESESHH